MIVPAFPRLRGNQARNQAAGNDQHPCKQRARPAILLCAALNGAVDSRQRHAIGIYIQLRRKLIEIQRGIGQCGRPRAIAKGNGQHARIAQRGLFAE